MKLQGKVVIVTGSASGMGREIAILYAREGANVSIVYLHSDEDANLTKKLIEKEGQECLLIARDIKKEKFCRDAVLKTIKRF